jgi:hypothetical protein
MMFGGLVSRSHWQPFSLFNTSSYISELESSSIVRFRVDSERERHPNRKIQRRRHETEGIIHLVLFLYRDRITFGLLLYLGSCPNTKVSGSSPPGLRSASPPGSPHYQSSTRTCDRTIGTSKPEDSSSSCFRVASLSVTVAFGPSSRPTIGSTSYCRTL